jgi:hypothetical protein
MLTCKRFENVIGSYLELFGKFKLCVKKDHLESLDRVQTLTQMRRNIGIVQLCELDLNVYTKAYNLFFQLLTKTGSRVMELEIFLSQYCFVSLANLLKLTPNITKLSLSQVRITPRTMPVDQIKLERLKTIEICSSSRMEIFEKLIKPNSLREIKISGASVGNYSTFFVNDHRCILRILSKQQKLVSLEFSQVPIIDFPELPDWNLENLQKLILDRVRFPTFRTPKNLQNFVGFVKKLDKFTELSLTVQNEEKNYDSLAVREEKQRKFAEMVTKLFSLPNSTKFEFEFDHENNLERIANIRIQNNGVEELTLKKIPVEGSKYSQFVDFFPNVRKAKLDFDDILGQLDLTSTNSWASLEEFELNFVTDTMLRQIKNLRSLKIDENHVESDISWNDFSQHNRRLERLEIKTGIFLTHLAVIAENLPNLKVLILKTIWSRGALIGIPGLILSTFR